MPRLETGFFFRDPSVSMDQSVICLAGVKRVEGGVGGWYSPIKVMGVLVRKF